MRSSFGLFAELFVPPYRVLRQYNGASRPGKCVVVLLRHTLEHLLQKKKKYVFVLLVIFDNENAVITVRGL